MARRGVNIPQRGNYNQNYPQAQRSFAVIFLIIIIIDILFTCNKSANKNTINDNPKQLQRQSLNQSYVHDVWLTDLQYLKKDEGVFIISNKTGKANTGIDYSHYMFSRQPYSLIIYHLNGQYEKFTALWTMCYTDRDMRYKNVFEMYADDSLVYTSPVITGGDLPVDIDVNIDYCNILTILFRDGTGAAELGNIRLSNSEKKLIPTTVQSTGVLPIWLTDLDYLTNNGVAVKSSGIGITNTDYQYSHYLFSNRRGNITYYLERKYFSISGLWTICQQNRNTETRESFEMYADDSLVYSSPVLTGGDMPINFVARINYCDRLEIVFTSGTGCGELGNILLK